MKKVNKRKGFTLAELLVVIAILAILIAIAVPIFGGAMDNARQTAIDANARSIKSAAMVKIMQENIAKGAGTDGGWEVVATVADDGSITITSCTGTTVGSDILPAQPAGGYTIYLRSTDL